MAQPETQAVLVPPPPAPPAGGIGAASPDPPRERPAEGRHNFLSAVIMELRRFVWPKSDGVWAGTAVTIGLLLLFALFICGLNVVAGTLASAFGIR